MQECKLQIEDGVLYWDLLEFALNELNKLNNRLALQCEIKSVLKLWRPLKGKSTLFYPNATVEIPPDKDFLKELLIGFNSKGIMMKVERN
jgi:hypothetical protein